MFSMLMLIISTVGLAFHDNKIIKAREILGSALDTNAYVTDKILTVKQLLSPLYRDQIKVVRCLGLNYADHAVGIVEWNNVYLANISDCYEVERSQYA